MLSGVCPGANRIARARCPEPVLPSRVESIGASFALPPRYWMRRSAVLLALFTATSAARADAVPPEPSCRPGYTGRTSHQGTWCEPPQPPEGCPVGSFWASDSEGETWCNGAREVCAQGCETTSLCVEEIDRTYGFRTGHDGEDYVEERVHGECAPDCACPKPYSCVTTSRRVPALLSRLPHTTLVCSADGGEPSPADWVQHPKVSNVKTPSPPPPAATPAGGSAGCELGREHPDTMALVILVLGAVAAQSRRRARCVARSAALDGRGVLPGVRASRLR